MAIGNMVFILILIIIMIIMIIRKIVPHCDCHSLIVIVGFHFSEIQIDSINVIHSPTL